MVVNTGVSNETPSAVPQLAKVIPLDSVRSRLAAVWGTGAGLAVLLVVVQSLLGRFGDRTQDAWGWLLPTIMPSLGMIVTVLGYTALDPLFSKLVVRKSFFVIAMVLSIGYLGLVTLTVLIGPFAAENGSQMVDLMNTSNLWLGPFQGLVASALGVLFVTKKKEGDA
jgi:hypothetical protein